jgi:hypothetical protein
MLVQPLDIEKSENMQSLKDFVDERYVYSNYKY